MNRRQLLGGGTAALATTAFGLSTTAAAVTPVPREAPSADRPNSFVDVSKIQEAFYGEEFLAGLRDISPDKGFIFVDDTTFVPLERFLRGRDNPFLNPTSTPYEKEFFTAGVMRAVNEITEDRPRLREYLYAFTDINQLLEFCITQGAYARMRGYHHWHDHEHPIDATILNLPAPSFNHQEFFSYSLGYPYNQREIIFPGTSRDWARFVALHEVGHSTENGSAETNRGAPANCEGRLEQIGYERIGDRVARLHFRAETPTNTQKVNDTWASYRALGLYYGIDTNAYLEGRLGDPHMTGIDWAPARREQELISNVLSHGANAAAVSMVRATHSLLETMGVMPEPVFTPLHPSLEAIFRALDIPIPQPPPPREHVEMNPQSPQHMITHARTANITVDEFAGIALALVQKGAFNEMPVARDAVLGFLRAVTTLLPDAINDEFGRVWTQTRGLPDETIQQMARAIARDAAPENYCSVLPPPPPRPPMPVKS